MVVCSILTRRVWLELTACVMNAVLVFSVRETGPKGWLIEFIGADPAIPLGLDAGEHRFPASLQTWPPNNRTARPMPCCSVRTRRPLLTDRVLLLFAIIYMLRLG